MTLPCSGFPEEGKKESTFVLIQARLSSSTSYRTLIPALALIDFLGLCNRRQWTSTSWNGSPATPCRLSLVFTKTDKEPPATVSANIAAFTARIAGWFEQLPAIF